MTRETSVDAYNAILALLPEARRTVYRDLHAMGNATSGELAAQNVMRHAAVSARLTELRNLGVVCEAGTRECKITGRRAIVWHITGNKPKPTPRKPTRAQLDADEIARLKARLSRCTCGDQGRLFG